MLILTLNMRGFRYLFSLRDWPLWVFLLSMCTGMARGIDKTVAVRSYFYIVATFFLIFYIGKIFVNEKRYENIAVIIATCSLLVAIIGIMEIYFGRNIIYKNFIDNPFYERYIGDRAMSTQLNPVALGSYFLGCLPFSFYLIKNNSACLRLLAIFSLVLSAAVTLLTFSRGVFLGLVALILFYLWKSKRNGLFAFFLCFSVLLVTVCSYQKNPNLRRIGFTGLVLGSYDSIISPYRLTRVKMAFKILKDYPFFGIGFNHFRIRFDEYYPEESRGREAYEFRIPDNMYLTFLAETGLIGTSGFLVFIFFLFKRGCKRISKIINNDKRHFLIISMSALIGLLVNMGAYELFYWHNPYMFFCLLCSFVGLDEKS